jgi:hypothetical protein
VRQELADQQPVMLGPEPPGQRLPQRRQLLPQAALGQVGEDLRVMGALDERLQHQPGRDPKRPGRHARQLDPGSLQDLVQPLEFPGALLDLRGAIPGQVPQLPDRVGRHKRRADHAVLQQLAQPGCIGHVALTAGQVAHVPGVE